MAPLVSVIIPTYNREKIITRAIDSVFAQTYRDFEIVVLDDGSQDNTKAVAQAYGPKVHYFYQDNKGIAGARNAGMHQTAGDYIAFLDSDDYWLPGKLERQIALFSEHPEYGMVGCQFWVKKYSGAARKPPPFTDTSTSLKDFESAFCEQQALFGALTRLPQNPTDKQDALTGFGVL